MCSSDLSFFLRLGLSLVAACMLALAIFMGGVALKQTVTPENDQPLSMDSPAANQPNLDDFFLDFDRVDKEGKDKVFKATASFAASQLVDCLSEWARNQSIRRDITVDGLRAVSHSEWINVLSIAASASGAGGDYFNRASQFVCAALNKEELADKIFLTGVDDFALEALTYLAQQSRQNQLLLQQSAQQQRVFAELDSRLMGTLQRLAMNPGVLLVGSGAAFVVFLLLMLTLRMIWLSKKLNLMDRSIRYGSLGGGGSSGKSSPTRVLPALSDVADRGLYVAAADIDAESNPKIITLTVANSSLSDRSAHAYFSFFNESQVKVGEHRSPHFSVPSEGIFSLRTEVPSNDGSWVTWRSEIIPS